MRTYTDTETHLEYTVLNVCIRPTAEFGSRSDVGVHRVLTGPADISDAIDRALNHGHDSIYFYADVAAELLLPYFDQFWHTSQVSPADSSFEICL
jgi:hypothetical protein